MRVRDALEEASANLTYQGPYRMPTGANYLKTSKHPTGCCKIKQTVGSCGHPVEPICVPSKQALNFQQYLGLRNMKASARCSAMWVLAV